MVELEENIENVDKGIDCDDNPNQTKLILVGESGTGKTSLITVSTGGEFKEELLSTSAPSVTKTEFKLGQKKYKVHLWDTLGNEKYRSLTKLFMKNAKIVVFVYDITNRHSFDELSFWVNKVDEILGKNPIKGLVANKADLLFDEKVAEKEGAKYAKSIGAKFKLASAKEDAEGFVEFLKELVMEYYVKINEIKINKNGNIINLGKSEKERKVSGCC